MRAPVRLVTTLKSCCGLGHLQQHILGSPLYGLGGNQMGVAGVAFTFSHRAVYPWESGPE